MGRLDFQTLECMCSHSMSLKNSSFDFTGFEPAVAAFIMHTHNGLRCLLFIRYVIHYVIGSMGTTTSPRCSVAF